MLNSNATTFLNIIYTLNTSYGNVADIYIATHFSLKSYVNIVTYYIGLKTVYTLFK